MGEERHADAALAVRRVDGQVEADVDAWPSMNSPPMMPTIWPSWRTNQNGPGNFSSGWSPILVASMSRLMSPRCFELALQILYVI